MMSSISGPVASGPVKRRVQPSGVRSRRIIRPARGRARRRGGRACRRGGGGAGAGGLAGFLLGFLDDALEQAPLGGGRGLGGLREGGLDQLAHAGAE